MRKLVITLLVVFVVAGTITGQESKAKENKEAKMKVKVEQITGQCHCGNIKFKAQTPIVKCSYCDCGGCQKATGTLKAPFVTVNKKGFKIIAGEPSSFRSASGVKCDAHGMWYFCPKCGTQIYWKGDKGNELDIFAGTLDDTSLFQPKK